MRDFLPQLSATDYVLDKRVVMVESGDLHYILKLSTFDAFVCKGCIILVLLWCMLLADLNLHGLTLHLD